MKIASMVKYTEKGKLVKKAQYAAFAEEMDKIAVSGRTVHSAWLKRVAGKLSVRGQVRDIAERLVSRERPIYQSWPLRRIPVAAMAKRASYGGLVDELEKISGTWLTNVGGKIVRAVKSAPRDSMHAVTDFAKRPVQSMKEGWKATWDPKMGKGGGKISGGLMLAGTAAGVAGSVPKKDPTGRQESRLTRGLRTGVGLATGLAAAKHGVIPGMALGVAGDVAAGYAGRRIDKMRKYAPPGAVEAPPTERT